MQLLTFGHGLLPQADLITVLHRAGVRCVVDVRTAPGSRRNPHANRHSMGDYLPAAGVEYRWEPVLGGWRRPVPNSPNVALHDPAFRGYADHMADPEFWTGLDVLLTTADQTRTAAMCSESHWEKCHRRLLADAAVLGRGAEVLHLAHDGSLTAHRVTQGARLAGPDSILYDVGHTQGLPLL